MKRSFLFIVLSCLFTFPLLSQGLYWESNVHRSMMGTDRDYVSQFYAMPKMFRSVEGEGREAIIRLDKEVIITVNRKDSTYTEMTFAEMESRMKEAGGKLDDAMAKLKDQLKDMPEDRRKMMEEMMSKRMGGGAEATYDVKKTDETQTISGFSCTKYIVSMGDKEVFSVWATKDVKGADALKTDMQEFQSRMAAMMPRAGGAIAAGMKSVEGFPIKMESDNYSSTVTKVEHRNTPAAEFEIPAGYKKTDMEKRGRHQQEEKQE